MVGGQRRDRAQDRGPLIIVERTADMRSEEHTSELQSQSNLVCRLLLEKKQRLDRLACRADARAAALCPVHHRAAVAGNQPSAATPARHMTSREYGRAAPAPCRCPCHLA